MSERVVRLLSLLLAIFGAAIVTGSLFWSARPSPPNFNMAPFEKSRPDLADWPASPKPGSRA